MQERRSSSFCVDWMDAKGKKAMGSGSKVGWASSISDFYSDNLSRLRFFEALGVVNEGVG